MSVYIYLDIYIYLYVHVFTFSFFFQFSSWINPNYPNAEWLHNHLEIPNFSQSNLKILRFVTNHNFLRGCRGWQGGVQSWMTIKKTEISAKHEFLKLVS